MPTNIEQEKQGTKKREELEKQEKTVERNFNILDDLRSIVYTNQNT